MPIGPGESEVRKVQMTGGATYTLSLPKPWVTLNGLRPRDGVVIDWRPSGALRLSPLDSAEEPRRLVILERASIPVGALYDHLMAAYLSGAESIRVRDRRGIGREDRSVIRSFLRSTRGFEVSDQSDEGITLVCLISSGELPISASLNRMYLQLVSLVRDIEEVLLGGEPALIEDHDEREREVDALLHLIDRQVGAMLDSHTVAESLGLDRRQATEHSNLARSLERMMDHADQMAALVLSTNPLPSMKVGEAPLSVVPQWLDAMRILMVQLRVREPHPIEEARTMLKEAQRSLVIHEEGLWGGRRRAASLLFDFRCSESIRRMCAYARDFGEVLLNMLVYDERMTVRPTTDGAPSK